MSQRSIALYIAGFLFISLLSAAATAPAAAKESLPVVQFVGDVSKVTAPKFVLIKHERDWVAVWADHTGLEASFVPPKRHTAPKIDFSRFMVVGVFKGTATNSDGAVALNVLADAEVVRVRFEYSTFQTASVGGNDAASVTTTPYGLWVIERTDRPIVFEEGRRRLKDQPVEWHEVQRLDNK